MAANRRLSFRMMRLCMLGAVLAGGVLSLLQIGIDGWRESRRIDQRIGSTLAVVRDSAAEAVYNIDDALARRVVDGLSRSDGVISATVALEDRALARIDGRAEPYLMRWLTDALFRPRREYRVPLFAPDGQQRLGSLQVAVDTAAAGRDFVERSLLVVVSGLIRALVLASLLLGLFHWLLTRPLERLTARLRQVNPAAPERTSLPMPEGHEQDELGEWARSVNALLAAIRNNLSAREQAEDQADFLQHFDTLTQLPNRALFHDRMVQRLTQAGGRGQRLALLLLDVSGFHHLNDSHGFEFGDQVLRELANRIESQLQAGDQATRMSGDRFGLLFRVDPDVEACLRTAEGLRTRLQQPLSIGGDEVCLDVRMGVALYPDDADQVEALVKHAENALSVARQSGQGAVQFYERSTGDQIRVRHRLRSEIESALSRGDLELHYQPQYDAISGGMVGVEALLRWPEALQQHVGIEELITLAEDSGQIIMLGEWVLNQACRHVAGWQGIGVEPLRVAVNISPRQLDDPRFIAKLDRALMEYGLAPDRLELEITETAVMRDIDHVIRQLEKIRDRGLRIAVDDFGTGHSSLQYLKRLPANNLKIDRSFVRDLCSNDGDAQIVAAILGLGRNLKKRVVAEGVENAEQLAFLQRLGCDEVQGFFFARPMSATEFIRFAANDTRAGEVIRASAATSIVD